MDRRALLRAATVTAAAAGVGVAARPGRAETAGTTASDAPRADSRSTPVDLGPAAMACNILTGGFVGDRPYVVSHLVEPARLGLIDPVAGTVTHLAELPTGSSAWTSLVDGDQVYIGTNPVADLYRFDASSLSLEHLASLPGATYVWDSCRTADGTIYLGTYPDGKIWEFDPGSDQLREIAVAVPGQAYVRSIVADDRYVYAGVGDQAHLVAFDRDSGERQDITPPELAEESFVYQLTQTSAHVIAGTHGNGLIAIVDKNDPSSCRVVHPEGVVTVGKMAALDDENVYFGAGNALWHLEVATGTTRQLATTVEGDFVTALRIRGETVVVFTNSATMWTYDITSGDLTSFDIAAAGMPRAPELPQSVHAHDGERIYVGGHGGVEVHDPARPGGAERLRVAGEAKAMTSVGRDLYFAMYPSGSIVRYDSARGSTETVAVVGNEQNRPGDMTYDPRSKLVLMTTSPDYGKLGGALSAFHVPTGRLDVHRDVVDGHAALSVAVHPGKQVAYVGTSMSGDDGVVAAFDLRRRETIAQLVPVPGEDSVPHVVVLGDALYGTTSRGTLFSVDLGSWAVRGTARIASGRVDLVVAKDRLYAVSHDRVLRIAPDDLAADVVVDGLNADATSFPMVSYDAGSLYTIGAGRNLLRIDVGLT